MRPYVETPPDPFFDPSLVLRMSPKIKLVDYLYIHFKSNNTAARQARVDSHLPPQAGIRIKRMEPNALCLAERAFQLIRNLDTILLFFQLPLPLEQIHHRRHSLCSDGS